MRYQEECGDCASGGLERRVESDSQIQPHELPTCFSTNKTYKRSTLHSVSMYAGTHQDRPIIQNIYTYTLWAVITMCMEVHVHVPRVKLTLCNISIKSIFHLHKCLVYSL